jgi:aspartate/methionine/tyrosine aminotransferase
MPSLREAIAEDSGRRRGIPVGVPLLEENNFSFDLNVFDRLIDEDTKLVILNSPGNPTGSVIPGSDLEHIARQVQKFNCWVMSDEIYARILYDGLEARSIASLPGMKERTILVDGFSKTYSMTGWRLGFGIMPRELARRVELLLTHSLGSTAHFTHFAGLEANGLPVSRRYFYLSPSTSGSSPIVRITGQTASGKKPSGSTRTWRMPALCAPTTSA